MSGSRQPCISKYNSLQTEKLYDENFEDPFRMYRSDTSALFLGKVTMNPDISKNVNVFDRC